jgi:hypothetical protein
MRAAAHYVLRLAGVTAPKPALSAELTLGEWMGAARAALADVSYDGVSRVDAGGLVARSRRVAPPRGAH